MASADRKGTRAMRLHTCAPNSPAEHPPTHSLSLAPYRAVLTATWHADKTPPCACEGMSATDADRVTIVFLPVGLANSGSNAAFLTSEDSDDGRRYLSDQETRQSHRPAGVCAPSHTRPGRRTSNPSARTVPEA